MNRATPVQMRKSLEVVETFKKAGLWFVPMPVFDEDDFRNRVSEMEAKLKEVERRANLVEAMKPLVPSNSELRGEE
jgi:hypothetical protein